MRELRVAADIRSEQLALQIGRSHDSIRAYELGRATPPAPIICRLAAALGCEPGDLFADDRVAV